MDGSEPPPPYSPVAATSDIIRSSIDRPAIPYIGPIPKLVDGSMVILQGIVPSKGRSFKATLSCAAALSGATDAALMISPVLDEKPGSYVLRNSMVGGRWGQEEKWGLEIPLKLGHQFEIIILVTKEHYKVALDGQHYCEFKHRMPAEYVTHLAVEGDVMLNFIRYQTPPSASASAQEVQTAAPPTAPSTTSQALFQNTVTSQHTTVYSTTPAPVPVVVPIPVGHHHHHLLPHLLPHHHHHHHHRRHGGFGHGGFGRHRRF